VLQFTAGGGTALVIGKVRDRQTSGDHAKPRIEGSKFAQKRLEGRLPYPSFLRTRRILKRLQAVKDQ
jgi:hypothetical protein